MTEATASSAPCLHLPDVCHTQRLYYIEKAEATALDERLDFQEKWILESGDFDARFADATYSNKAIHRLTYGDGDIHCFGIRDKGASKFDNGAFPGKFLTSRSTQRVAVLG